MLRKLWTDEGGALLSSEFLVLSTVLVIALMAAWVVVRNAVVTQIHEQAMWVVGEDPDDPKNELKLEPINDGEVVTCDDIFEPGA